MTQEEKQLLLKDLCARLPYGVKVLHGDGVTISELRNICHVGWCYKINSPDNNMYNGYLPEGIKPYLRPMSSMTEEERKELKTITCPNGTGYFNEQYLVCPINHFGEQISFDFMASIIDYLNAHRFDYRNLIDNGLALEATEDMYKTK